MRLAIRIPLAAMLALIVACLTRASIAADAPATARPHLPPSFGLIFASEQVHDIERSLAFYTKVFGMRVLNSYNTGDFKERQLVFGETPTAGGINIIQRETKNEPFQGDRPIHLVIRVHDVRATCDRVAAAGGKVTRVPAEAAGSRISVGMVEDPDGHRLEIVEYD